MDYTIEVNRHEMDERISICGYFDSSILIGEIVGELNLNEDGYIFHFQYQKDLNTFKNWVMSSYSKSHYSAVRKSIKYGTKVRGRRSNRFGYPLSKTAKINLLTDQWAIFDGILKTKLK